MNDQLSSRSKLAIFIACILIVGGAFTFAVLNWAGALPIQPPAAQAPLPNATGTGRGP